MDWLAGVVTSVVVSLASTKAQRLLSPKLNRPTRSMVKRFQWLMAAHRVPVHQASRLMGVSIPAGAFASNEGIARVLTPDRLDTLCQRLAIRSEWLIRGEGEPQSPWSIERSSSCWIDELGEAKLSGDTTIVVCRSEPIELEDHLRQAGAIIRLRQIGTCGEKAIHACLPCMSLQNWSVPYQRDMATRLIVACNALKVRMIGVTIPASDCQHITEGRKLATTYASKCHSMVWHPSDYGNSPRSACAKNPQWHRDTVRRMEAAGQIGRLVDWQMRLGIHNEWADDALLRAARS